MDGNKSSECRERYWDLGFARVWVMARVIRPIDGGFRALRLIAWVISVVPSVREHVWAVRVNEVPRVEQLLRSGESFCLWEKNPVG